MNINKQNFHYVGLPLSSEISGYATAHVGASITRRAVRVVILGHSKAIVYCKVALV